MLEGSLRRTTWNLPMSAELAASTVDDDAGRRIGYVVARQEIAAASPERTSQTAHLRQMMPFFRAGHGGSRTSAGLDDATLMGSSRQSGGHGARSGRFPAQIKRSDVPASFDESTFDRF